MLENVKSPSLIIRDNSISEEQRQVKVKELADKYIVEKYAKRCTLLFIAITNAINDKIIECNDFYKQIMLSLENRILYLESPIDSSILIKHYDAYLSFPEKHKKLINKYL